ncbi:uncharacterized protein LOC110179036 [Drosophila serrata]|uniref:uncharacterized protein LOC110179036 n=1 Tax=Drosophila serrata TaxID=7274 RepID=UPI000A1D1C13|nr:uncharacterized protein LOC110179036 [Drosophila serrata]
MDSCANDILAPIILAVMVANGHPLTLDDIADGVSEVIYSQRFSEDMVESIGDGKHDRKRLPQKRS